jgi:ABC-type Na+ efflux pump permease subunit
MPEVQGAFDATYPIEMPPAKGINWGAVWGIIGKDLRVVTRSKAVMIPMIVVPLILVVLLPVGMAIGLNFFGTAMAGNDDTDEAFAMATAVLQPLYPDYSGFQIVALFVLTTMFAPLFLILPIMAASVVAADAFAGEKERKTLEALLYTPTSDTDLFVAKAIGALIPGIAIAWGSALINWIAVDIAAWPIFGHPILPNASWLILALWVAPAAAAVGLGATVIASARAKTFQDASQISGMVIFPIILLMLGQSLGFFLFGPWITFLVGLGLYAVAAVLFFFVVRSLRRSELLARL